MKLRISNFRRSLLSRAGLQFLLVTTALAQVDVPYERILRADARLLTTVAAVASFFVSSLDPRAAATDPARPGGERTIYRDAETGRTIWRMTVSKTNDKHCYYSEQPWSPDMKRILFSVGLPTDQSKVGSIWVMDADGSNFRKLADPVPYNMHTGANPVWSPNGSRSWGGWRVRPAGQPDQAAQRGRVSSQQEEYKGPGPHHERDVLRALAAKRCSMKDRRRCGTEVEPGRKIHDRLLGEPDPSPTSSRRPR